MLGELRSTKSKRDYSGKSIMMKVRVEGVSVGPKPMREPIESDIFL